MFARMQNMTSVSNSDVIAKERSVKSQWVVDKLSFIPWKSAPDTQLEFRRLPLREQRNSAARRNRQAKLLAQRVTLVFRFLPDRFALAFYTPSLAKIFPAKLSDRYTRALANPGNSGSDNSILQMQSVTFFFLRMEIVKFHVEENRARQAWMYRFKI